MSVSYKIHPSIGIARVGDSDDFYIGPETPGGLPILPDGGSFEPADFRDGYRRLKRQAARFRVFRYDAHHPQGVEVELGKNHVARIEWTAHLANKKAIWYQFFVNSGEQGYSPDHPLRNPQVTDPEKRIARIIDPGPRTLSGPNQAAEFSRDSPAHGYPTTWPPPHLEPFSIDTLGGVRTDAQSRLLVLGGHGRSGSSRQPPTIVDYANNDDWWDDTSDGPVSAQLVLDDGTVVPVEGAWVLVAPPKYAPQIENLVTLYDTMLDTAVRHLGYRPEIYRDSLWNRDYVVGFEREILPILQRVEHYPWVVAIPPHPHHLAIDKLGDPNPDYDRLRQYYLAVIRPPSAPNNYTSAVTGYPMMPFLAGDNAFEPGPLSSSYLTVTDTQYFFLAQWAAGKFKVGSTSETEPPGAALDRAVLENCVGGAFSPGIEMTWISRNPRIYAEPFRLHHKKHVIPPLSLGENLSAGLEPGDGAKYMALPWQADFNECSVQPVGDRYLWWWPAQRPLFVHLDEKPSRQVPWVGTAADQTAPDYVQFADDIDMVSLWKQLGFVWNAGSDGKPHFVEVERNLPRKPRCPEGEGEDG